MLTCLTIKDQDKLLGTILTIDVVSSLKHSMISREGNRFMTAMAKNATADSSSITVSLTLKTMLTNTLSKSTTTWMTR
jgi:hypothetical protein